MKKQLAFSVLLSAISTMAFAHPDHGLTGHALQSAYTGFLHPLTGWDHLLMMLAVGVWAAKMNKNAVWKLPLTFITAMFLGFLLSLNGFQLRGVETSIAASVIAMGVLLMMNLPIKPSVQFALVALFAVFHGMAHGIELNAQSGFSVLFGMLFATALLHGVGILLGSFKDKLFQWLQHGLAVGMILVGGYALVLA